MNSIIRIILSPLLFLAVGLLFIEAESIPESNIKSGAYPEHLPGKFTGGFGEETCHSCHFDYPLNFEEGALQVDGLPEQYENGNSYMLQIYIGRPDLKKAGFQLSARFPDGSQAGTFSIRSDRIKFTAIDSGDVQYVQHSLDGTEPSYNNRTVWALEWTAPSEAASEVIFHISGNAANGDASEFGDYILTREIKLNGSGTRQ